MATGVSQGLQHKSVLFSVKTTHEMAPSARVLVYYVMEDGEILTDSVGFEVNGAFDNEVRHVRNF